MQFRKQFRVSLFLCVSVFILTSCQNGVIEKKGTTVILNQNASTVTPVTTPSPTPTPTPSASVTGTQDPDPTPTPDTTATPLAAMTAGPCESWPVPNITVDTSWSSINCAAGKTAYCYKLSTPFAGTGNAVKSHQYTNAIGTKLMVIYDAASEVRNVQIEVCSANVAADSGYVTLNGDFETDTIGTALSAIFQRTDGVSISQDLTLQGTYSSGLGQY